MVESKWSRTDGGKTFIHPNQVRRHAIFHVYLDKLFTSMPTGNMSIDEVILSADSELHVFQYGSPNRTNNSALFSNLRYVLGAIRDIQPGVVPHIHNLVLNFPNDTIREHPGPVFVHPPNTGLRAVLPEGVNSSVPLFTRIDVLDFARRDFVDLCSNP